MKKALRKVIMHRSKLKNTYHKSVLGLMKTGLAIKSKIISM